MYEVCFIIPFLFSFIFALLGGGGRKSKSYTHSNRRFLDGSLGRHTAPTDS